MQVTLGRTLQVVVPDIAAGVIQTDALEAVVEANGPPFRACSRRKQSFRYMLEASYECVFLRGRLHWTRGRSFRCQRTLHTGQA